MTQLDRSSVSRHMDEYKAGVSEPQIRAQSGSNRIEAAYQQIVRWFGAAWLEQGSPGDPFGRNRVTRGVSGNGPGTEASTMLPASARSNRKPWVASQLPV